MQEKKNPQKKCIYIYIERERERERIFLCGKTMHKQNRGENDKFIVRQ